MGDKTDKELRQDMWKAMSSSPYVMLGLDSDHRHFEAMYAVTDPDADSEFWFYTKKDNRAAPGGPAHVTFVSKGHDLFASISGTLVEETRPDIKQKYFNNQVEAWYDQGLQDPELLMLRFDLGTAEIWEQDQSLLGKLKMITGQTIKGSEEAGSHTKTGV